MLENLKKYYIINSSVLACKLASYIISIALCINSVITASFSLQRALVINFPLKFNNFRENNKKLFKIIIASIVVISTLLPMYTLLFINLTTRNIHGETKCDIISKYELQYFNLTICFIILTLPLPFSIIFISNVSILLVIDRNRRNLLNNRLVNTEKIDKSMRNTKILLVISTCFVLLNFPYFIAWFRYAIFRVSLNSQNRNSYTESEVKTLSELYDMVKFTEISNLFNYAFIGVLYFASGKIFRSHLNSVIGLDSLLKKPRIDNE